MKLLLTSLAAICGLTTLAVLILFVTVLFAWLNGGGNVLLPGLGLIIGAPLILLILFVVGAAMFFFTVLFIRKIFALRLR